MEKKFLIFLPFSQLSNQRENKERVNGLPKGERMMRIRKIKIHLKINDLNAGFAIKESLFCI